MALLTHSQKRSIDLIVPFALSGWVFYDSFIKKGKGGEIKTSVIMTLIVFAFAYIVTTQVTRLVSDPQ